MIEGHLTLTCDACAAKAHWSLIPRVLGDKVENFDLCLPNGWKTADQFLICEKHDVQIRTPNEEELPTEVVVVGKNDTH